MKKTLLLILINIILCAGVAFSQSAPLAGNWFDFNDVKDNGGSSTVTMAQATRDGMPAYRFTGRVTNQYQYGFAGWGIVPDAATLANLRTAKGISFKVLGDGKRYTVKFRLDANTVKDFGNHEFTFPTTAGEVITVEVPIRMFMQPPWAERVRLDQSKVMDITWQTHESWRPDSYDITIWDVRIMQ
jgi:hypothetical protein